MIYPEGSTPRQIASIRVIIMRPVTPAPPSSTIAQSHRDRQAAVLRRGPPDRAPAGRANGGTPKPDPLRTASASGSAVATHQPVALSTREGATSAHRRQTRRPPRRTTMHSVAAKRLATVTRSSPFAEESLLLGGGQAVEGHLEERTKRRHAWIARIPLIQPGAANELTHQQADFTRRSTVMG